MESPRTSDANAAKLLEPGDMFGDYTVEKLLGEGGMGAVYLVRAPGGERYAVKLMSPEMMKKGSDFRKRFAREAEFAMKIRHKNLISVYDVGEDPETGYGYIIMDYVPGGSVADRLEKSGPLPMAEAVSIAAQVALALEVAHRHGVIHRDIKPDNIMFDADGTPKLADLGVAKFTDDAHKTKVTTTGMIIGTPAYMAPEQMMDSHHVDARADIYALGVVLYEMLTGKRPNEGSTAVELLAKALKGEPLPDVRTMRPEVSAAIAHVLSLMCAPKPENRPATALAAAQLLQKAASGRLVLPKKKPRAADAAARKGSKRRISVALCALGAIAVGSVALCLLGPTSKKKALPPASVVVTNVVERTSFVTNVVVQELVQPGAVSRPTKGRSPFEMRKRHRGVTPEPGWISIATGETFDVAMSLDAFTTGGGNVRRVLCSYYPQTNKYQEIRWYGDAPTGDRLDRLPETGDLYIRADDRGTHLVDLDMVCEFNVLCHRVKVDFSKLDGTIPYDRSTFEYKAFTRDWCADNPKRTLISLTHPWITARRDEILQVVGDDHVDYAYRAYTLVTDEFAHSRKNTDISETILQKSGDETALASVFVSILRSAGIPARTLCGKKPDGNIALCPEFYVEGCGWIPADIVKDIGHGKEPKHFGFYDETCVVLASDLDVTVKAARDDPIRLERIWPCWWWLYSGAWTPCDTRFSWDGAATTEQGYRNRSASSRRNRNAAPSPTPRKDTRQIVLFPRLDRSPIAWSYSFEEAKNWKSPNYDDSGWKRAPGGFGQRDTFSQLANARLGAAWGTQKIFLRKRFQWNGGDVSRAVIDAYHDDDMTIWLNGRLMMTDNGSNSDWQPFDIPASRFNKALRKGVNVLCVEVHNNWQSQYFDCGLMVECDGVRAPHAGPDAVRMVKTGAGTWTVRVVDGVAQLGNGTDVALNPRPKGRLVIPSELDGIPIRKLAFGCFKDCDEIESVVIPEGVRSVGGAAFFNCRSLSDVAVPETLEHIGFEALHGTSLKRIDLKNTRLLEGSVFKFCERLEKVSVNPGNPTFAVKDGVLYDKVRRAVVVCPRSRTSYVFPLGIEDVYASAFTQCKIRDIEIPETVKGVWDCAFECCPLLQSVKFRGDDVLLGGWSFGNNPSLRSIALPSRQKSLDAWAIFNHAESLETVILPDTVETVGVGVFENCSRLRRVGLGKSLRVVRFRAFAGCSQLGEIKFPNTLKELGAEAFLNCQSLEKVFFAGNAPSLVSDADRLGDYVYRGASQSLVTFVPKDSVGWAGDSHALPPRWPVNGNESARAIRHGN